MSNSFGARSTLNVDGREYEPGPITQTLQARYADICRGKDEKYLDWLDFVRN